MPMHLFMVAPEAQRLSSTLFPNETTRKQLPLRSDPVPLPRSPSILLASTTKTDPKPNLMFGQRTLCAHGTLRNIHDHCQLVKVMFLKVAHACRAYSRRWSAAASPSRGARAHQPAWPV